MKFSGRFKPRFEANVDIGGSVSELGGFATSRLNNRGTLIVIGQIYFSSPQNSACGSAVKPIPNCKIFDGQTH